MDNKVYIAIVFVAICVLVFMFFALPTWNSTQSYILQVGQKEKELKTVQAEVAQQKKLAEKYELAKSKKIDSILPVKLDRMAVITEQLALAEESGVAFKSLEITDQANTKSSSKQTRTTSTDVEKYFKTASVKISIEGSYTNLKKYLNNIESSIHLMDVKTFSFPKAKDSENESLSANLVADLYYTQ